MKNQYLEKLYKKGLGMHHITNTAYPLTPASLYQHKITDNEDIKILLKKDIESCDELSLYVHIPFCQNRCKFCEYAVVSGSDRDQKDKYIEYLLKEIDMYKEFIGDKLIVGFDMGGGTPTQLSSKQIKTITDHLHKTFNFDPHVTMSIETTPLIAATNPKLIKDLYKIGYRRISMGIQTIDTKLLESFEREGSTKLYDDAINNIRLAGFEKFNIDLMYGFLN